MTYTLIDSGGGEKLEQFGKVRLIRPCSQAVWSPQFPNEWKSAHARFTRDEGNHWEDLRSIPKEWEVDLKGLIFKLLRTDFGHLGIFPEHAQMWEWMETIIKKAGRPVKILNLFAYSGAATLAAARAGAEVCHLDASQGMVAWARENAAKNGLEKAPIRWIVDDALKFVAREVRRGRKYDGILLDPPTFGRGKKGEIFQIETDLVPLLDDCSKLLSDKPLFNVLSCHTPGFTPLVLHNLLDQAMKRKGKMTQGELTLEGKGYPLPTGAYARWEHA